MIAAFILALALTFITSISGVVRDTSGAVVADAAVIVRPASGPEIRTVTGPEGRFVVESTEAGEVTIVVRAGGFAEKTQNDADANRAATRRCARERQRDHHRGDPGVARIARRRRAPPGAVVQPLPPDQQPRGAADGAGSVAARDWPQRSEPHAGAARWHPVQRSIRRLGVLDPRAAGERRSRRDHRRLVVEPVREHRDGRRHQHHHEPSHAPHD